MSLHCIGHKTGSHSYAFSVALARVVSHLGRGKTYLERGNSLRMIKDKHTATEYLGEANVVKWGFMAVSFRFSRLTKENEDRDSRGRTKVKVWNALPYRHQFRPFSAIYPKTCVFCSCRTCCTSMIFNLPSELLREKYLFNSYIREMKLLLFCDNNFLSATNCSCRVPNK